MVRDKHTKKQANASLTEDDDVIQALGTDRSNDALGVRIAFWTFRRNAH
jgi:hypothetical protein